MVAQEPDEEREPMTVADIARRFDRKPHVVRNDWVGSPEWNRLVRRVGKRGRWVLYDAQGVEEFARGRVWLPPKESDIPADRLLDQKEIADYSGIGYSAVRSDISRGALGEPDEDRDGVRRWTRASVDRGFWARQIHRPKQAE